MTIPGHKDSPFLFLMHWKAAEAEALVVQLRALGWAVEIEAANGARGGKRIQALQPAVVVIYLTRLPSHERETADYLATAKATRHIPVLFVGGHLFDGSRTPPDNRRTDSDSSNALASVA